VYEDAAWDHTTFDIDRAMKAADDKLARVLNATDPDLGKFRARGGRLILYHGWCDAAIAPQNTIDYYNSVIAKMGAKAAQEFVRLYMVPGMQHCSGGPGPNLFGQGGAPQADAQHDMAAALEQWVEKGAVPGQIVAAGPGASPRTRPLCPFPETARYSGTGSTDDSRTFACYPPPAN
jgi:hypothetical protein